MTDCFIKTLPLSSWAQNEGWNRRWPRVSLFSEWLSRSFLVELERPLLDTLQWSDHLLPESAPLSHACCVNRVFYSQPQSQWGTSVGCPSPVHPDTSPSGWRAERPTWWDPESAWRTNCKWSGSSKTFFCEHRGRLDDLRSQLRGDCTQSGQTSKLSFSCCCCEKNTSAGVHINMLCDLSTLYCTRRWKVQIAVPITNCQLIDKQSCILINV